MFSTINQTHQIVCYTITLMLCCTQHLLFDDLINYHHKLRMKDYVLVSTSGFDLSYCWEWINLKAKLICTDINW